MKRNALIEKLIPFYRSAAGLARDLGISRALLQYMLYRPTRLKEDQVVALHRKLVEKSPGWTWADTGKILEEDNPAPRFHRIGETRRDNPDKAVQIAEILNPQEAEKVVEVPEEKVEPIIVDVPVEPKVQEKQPIPVDFGSLEIEDDII